MASRRIDSHPLYELPTVGVCGSSKGLSQSGAELCRAIGRRLAAEPNLVIVSGGKKQRSRVLGTSNYAADWLFVKAAESELSRQAVSERIMTVVVDADDEPSAHFRIGTIQPARGKTSEARRISFVRALDALIAVGGSSGTRQELALAMEFHKHVLPVPGYGGASEAVWSAYRAELINSLRISESDARRWEERPSTDVSKIQKLADEMVGTLLASIPKRCFVIMPFRDDLETLYDSVIAPSVTALGDVPVRVDRVGAPGNVTAQIERGLRSCDYAIAVLDHLRPNVLYELGMAHAHNKPVILLNSRGAFEDGVIPFDISTQQRLEFLGPDEKLMERLKRTIYALRRR